MKNSIYPARYYPQWGSKVIISFGCKIIENNSHSYCSCQYKFCSMFKVSMPLTVYSHPCKENKVLRFNFFSSLPSHPYSASTGLSQSSFCAHNSRNSKSHNPLNILMPLPFQSPPLQAPHPGFPFTVVLFTCSKSFFALVRVTDYTAIIKFWWAGYGGTNAI